MRGLIYFLKDNDFVEMNEEGRQEERLSQELLAQRPILFTGDGISGQPPRRHLLVSGQVPVPAMQGAPGQWRLDLFFWQKMEANLKTGVAQMTYMSDNLPREIIRIIDF